MAVYEKRTYSVTVGRMQDLIRLYTDEGWPVIEAAGFERSSSDILSVTQVRFISSSTSGVSTTTATAAISGNACSRMTNSWPSPLKFDRLSKPRKYS